jgi:hypothetical protein
MNCAATVFVALLTNVKAKRPIPQKSRADSPRSDGSGDFSVNDND